MNDTDIDLTALVAVIMRQRRLIFLTLALILGLSSAYLVLARPIFSATTLVQIDTRGTNLLDPAGPEPQQGLVNARIDSEVEILRSSSTALDVVQAGDLIHAPDFGPRLGWVEKLGIVLGLDLSPAALRHRLGLATSDPKPEDLVAATLQKLQSAVEVKRQGLSFLIAITLSSPDPARAADLANLYARTYIDTQVASKTASLLGARDVLRRQIATAQDQLTQSETAVNDFIESNLARLEKDSGDPAIAEFRHQLESAKEDQRRVSGQLAEAQSAIDARDWDAAAKTLGDAAVAELARQRRDVHDRLAKAGADAAQMLDLTQKLNDLDASLAARAGASMDGVRAQMAALDSREASTRDQLRAALLQSDLSAGMLTDLFNLQQSATIARSQYQTLLSREQDLGTLANLQIADARIVSQALPPNKPSAPNRRLILALALMGGLGLGVLLGFLREYYIGGISSASQLQNIMQVRVPVTVPKVDAPDGGTVADLVVRSPMSPYAETFRKLRAAIDLGRPSDTPGKVILVCSALPGEGKTTTAIALARTYALSGASTLLIDADLRKPMVDRRMGVASDVGLLQYLVSWDKDSTAIPDLALDPETPLVVLTAGERSAVPTDQLINSKGFSVLLNSLAPEFDTIIIDSPPLLPVVDTRYLAGQADSILQVVRYGSTNQTEAREAAFQLQDLVGPAARLLGVLNQEDRSNGRYAYDRNYGRY